MYLESARPSGKLFFEGGRQILVVMGIQIGEGYKLRVNGVNFVRPFEGHDARRLRRVFGDENAAHNALVFYNVAIGLRQLETILVKETRRVWARVHPEGLCPLCPF